jgi:hypothetical protein
MWEMRFYKARDLTWFPNIRIYWRIGMISLKKEYISPIFFIQFSVYIPPEPSRAGSRTDNHFLMLLLANNDNKFRADKGTEQVRWLLPEVFIVFLHPPQAISVPYLKCGYNHFHQEIFFFSLVQCHPVIRRYCDITAGMVKSEWTPIAGQLLANIQFARHISDTTDWLLRN